MKKKKQTVSRTDPHIQFVTLEFKDGTSATFSGPAILFADDEPKKIKAVKFSDPRPLPKDCSWGPLKHD